MAGTVSPQLNWDDTYPEHPVNELLSQKAGGQAPFGDDVSLPLPIEDLYYVHPTRRERPNLAGH
jgi:hypothetical protein